MRKPIIIGAIAVIFVSMGIDYAFAGTEPIITVQMNDSSTFYLDSPNKIIRATLEIQNYTPSDGQYFMKVTHLPTNKVLKDFEIYPKPASNDLWSLQIAYPILESDIKDGGQILFGEYQIHIRTEFGSQTASTKFLILESQDDSESVSEKPSPESTSTSSNPVRNQDNVPEVDCESLEKERDEWRSCYTDSKCPYEGVTKEESFEQLGNLTMKIRNLCLSPEELCDIGNNVYFENECLKISEVPRDVYFKAFHHCNDLSSSQKMAGHHYPVQPCIKEKVLLYLTNPELLEPEPEPTIEEQYPLICSGPDRYCLSKIGMNNPEAYNSCLDRWNAFCKTYEAKQTQVIESEILCGPGTIEKNGQCVDDTSQKLESDPSRGGGCLIATATYGSELAPQVQQLRELRDNKLLQTESGSAFMESFNDFYYSFSPVIADYEHENPIFKEAVKLVITPMVSSLSILNYVSMDSEAEVLGYGISLILLNIGMYFIGPATILWKLKK